MKRLKEKDLFEKILKSREDVIPIRIGRVYGSDADFYIDFDQVSKTHLAVLGTTGSGKSHFVKSLIKKISSDDNVKIYIFDPHGEYADELPDALGKRAVEVVNFEGNPKVITSGGEVVNILKDLEIHKGINKIFALKFFGEYFDYDPVEMLNQAELLEDEFPYDLDRPVFVTSVFGSKKDSESAAEIIKKVFYEIKGKIVGDMEMIDEKLKDISKNIIVFNMKNLESPTTRVEVAGYIASKIFNMAKSEEREGMDEKNIRRFIVLEEAHNFAPERSFGDVSGGKNNPAFRMFTKIGNSEWVW